MNEQQFQSEMRRAETMRRLTSDPTEAEYLAGYIRGLRRGYHGEQFGTQAEHKLWMSLADDEASVRELTGAELARLASGRHVENLALTCEGDTGHGPCGTYLDWTDGTCAPRPCHQDHRGRTPRGTWPRLSCWIGISMRGGEIVIKATTHTLIPVGTYIRMSGRQQDKSPAEQKAEIAEAGHPRRLQGGRVVYR